jgi:hypothetical protein
MPAANIKIQDASTFYATEFREFPDLAAAADVSQRNSRCFNTEHLKAVQIR